MKEITGYTSSWSVEPGEQISFMVSCYGPSTYNADIVRLLSGETVPEGPDLTVEEVGTDIDGRYDGQKQEIFAGSYVRVDDHGSLAIDDTFSLQMFAYPTTPAAGRQALVTKWDDDAQCGYGLFIDENARLKLVLGNGNDAVFECRTEEPVVANRWYFLGASVNLGAGEITLHQHVLDSTKNQTLYSSDIHDVSVDGPIDINAVGTPEVPFMMAASAKQLNGDESPVSTVITASLKPRRSATAHFLSPK